MYSKFYYLDQKVLVYLFKAFATTFYGVELWYDYLLKRDSIRKLEVAYHKSVKRICRMNRWESNHEACDRTGMEIFCHLVAKRILRSFFNVLNSKSPCMKDFRFLQNSHL